MNGIYIPGLNMPNSCVECLINYYFCHMDYKYFLAHQELYDQRSPNCPLIPVPPHGDLIDRDALIKDGWLNLHKEVIRMGGYAIHELPLKNPSIPVIIPASEEVYDKYTDTAGNLHWTGTQSGKHIVKAEEGE